MGLHVTYTPPKADAGVLMAGAKVAAEDAVVEALLTASQPLVPVDTGDLKESGQTGRDGIGAYVAYEANSPEGYPYGIRQHEDLGLHHPNGGQAKYLETPMHANAETWRTIIHASLKAAGL